MAQNRLSRPSRRPGEQPRRSGTLKAVFVALLCLVLGYFAGREHLKYEIKSAVTSAVEGVKQSFADLGKGLAPPGTTGSSPANIETEAVKGKESSPEVWSSAESPVNHDVAQLRIVSVKVGKAKAKKLMDKETTDTKEDILKIEIVVTNTSSSLKLGYMTWGAGGSLLGSDHTRLKDNFGNSYSRVLSSNLDSVVGRTYYASVYPGKTVRDILLFEKPVDDVKHLDLELPAKNFDGKGVLRIRIPAAMILKEAQVPGIPTPPTSAEEVAWRESFVPFQEELAFHNFKEMPSERLTALRRHMSTLPSSLIPEVSEWFLGQAVLIPSEVWPKREWMEKREDAERRMRWCRTVVSLLEGTDEKFAQTRKLAAAGAERFAPVAAWRGSVTLSLNATPIAEVRSLRSGDAWVVKDGRRVGKPPADEVLYTPLVLEDLDIADFTLMLAHPQKGEVTLSISASGLRHGKRYVYSGSLDKAESFTLREER